jgi:hypothetical protein
VAWCATTAKWTTFIDRLQEARINATFREKAQHLWWRFLTLLRTHVSKNSDILSSHVNEVDCCPGTLILSTVQLVKMPGGWFGC